MRTATRFFRPRERQRYCWLFWFPKVFASSLADVHATDRFNTLVETVTPPWRWVSLRPKIVSTSEETKECCLAHVG